MQNIEFSFELITQDDQARLGRIVTSKGQIDTPAFMPVGTQGTVKSVFIDDLLKTNTQIILGNTYHLFLRPGVKILEKFSGLHNFMNWKKPILTDSGGYQIMSLSKFNKIDIKLGAIFKSHLDGKKIILSPEKSIQIHMFNILNETVPLLPKKKPRYLMGVGTPSDILGAVKEGIDMFDCVLPTRSGRTGLAFTWEGKLNLKNSKFKSDNSPLDEKCDIRDLNRYSKSYLNHLIKSDEILASMLISLHNINFYQQFMREIRNNIKKGTFKIFYKKYINFFD